MIKVRMVNSHISSWGIFKRWTASPPRTTAQSSSQCLLTSSPTSWSPDRLRWGILHWPWLWCWYVGCVLNAGLLLFSATRNRLTRQRRAFKYICRNFLTNCYFLFAIENKGQLQITMDEKLVVYCARQTKGLFYAYYEFLLMITTVVWVLVQFFM